MPRSSWRFDRARNFFFESNLSWTLDIARVSWDAGEQKKMSREKERESEKGPYLADGPSRGETRNCCQRRAERPLERKRERRVRYLNFRWPTVFFFSSIISALPCFFVPLRLFCLPRVFRFDSSCSRGIYFKRVRILFARFFLRSAIPIASLLDIPNPSISIRDGHNACVRSCSSTTFVYVLWYPTKRRNPRYFA